VSGFVVASMGEAVAAAEKLARLDRGLVRRAFERRFTVECMTRDYLAIYQQRLNGQGHAQRSLEAANAPSMA
jgi:hypothetical protein